MHHCIGLHAESSSSRFGSCHMLTCCVLAEILSYLCRHTQYSHPWWSATPRTPLSPSHELSLPDHRTHIISTLQPTIFTFHPPACVPPPSLHLLDSQRAPPTSHLAPHSSQASNSHAHPAACQHSPSQSDLPKQLRNQTHTSPTTGRSSAASLQLRRRTGGRHRRTSPDFESGMRGMEAPPTPRITCRDRLKAGRPVLHYPLEAFAWAHILAIQWLPWLAPYAMQVGRPQGPACPRAPANGHEAARKGDPQLWVSLLHLGCT